MISFPTRAVELPPVEPADVLCSTNLDLSLKEVAAATADTLVVGSATAGPHHQHHRQGLAKQSGFVLGAPACAAPCCRSVLSSTARW